MDAEVVSHCIGPLSQKYLYSFPHHITPSMNLHKDIVSGDGANPLAPFVLKQCPYVSSCPIPIAADPSNVPREVLNGIDPTTSLIREKMKWQIKKDKLVKATKRDKKNISGKVIKRAVKAPVDSRVVVPQGIVMLAQHLAKDPDPNFHGSSNWYYCGGTLAPLQFKGDDYLLQATNSEINLSRLIGGDQAKLLSTTLCETEGPIYQIVSNSGGAAVRHKSCITLLGMDDSDNELQLNKVHTLTDKQSFISLAVSNNSIKTFCTTSNSRMLKLWDIEDSKKLKFKAKVLPGNGVTVNDNWSCVEFLDNQTLVFADRCCLHILDVRTKPVENQQLWCPRHLTEHCEQQSYVFCSQKRDNIVYVATTHQLFTLDLRYGYLQRCTHMLTSPPHMGFSQPLEDNEEAVCLGSQVDCAMVLNSWQNEEPKASYYPYSLPALPQGLLLARQQGLCLDPMLTQRFTQSVTGLTCVPNDRGLGIMRQTATGDVFVQQLSKSNERSSDQLSEREVSSYSEWSKTLQRGPIQVNVSLVCTELQPILKALKKEKPIKKPVEETSSTKIGTGWQLSKKYLEDCVDLLAGKMLAVWDIEDEEEWYTREEEEEDSITEQDPEEKVMNWLDNTNPEASNNLWKTTDIHSVESTTIHPERDSSSPSDAEPNPWMTQPSQVVHTPVTNRSRDSYIFAGQQCSPSSSDNSIKQKRKKLRTLNYPTTPKQSTSVKKPQSAVKKQTPGF